MGSSHYEYPVHPGDTLGKILQRMYGLTPGSLSAVYPVAEQAILAMNPHIKDPDRIATGKIILITGVRVTAACVQIAHTVGQQEKNAIFVGTVAGTAMSTAISAGIGLYLVSNPVEWGTALVLATLSTGVSWGFGKGAVKLYDLKFREIDLVAGLGADHVCNS